MSKISKLSIEKKIHEGYPGKIVFANFLIDGIPLINFKEFKDKEYVSCLGWGPKEFQQKQIDRLLLKVKSDFDKNNRNSIYICPCSDLGCGAVSLKIKRSSKDDNIIIWYKLGYENTLEDWSSKLENYYGIGPFYFDWDQYKETIESSLLFGKPDYWHSDKWR
ncbi:hypothetical protein ACFCYN_03400 [Gottfriedia sp. NPDC056225]|uniref:hypothetical protein n=1 Tax=Gottfriedia sp. NPDC056225 TaxID=3345751 RepID=UPI0035D9AFE5